MAHGMESNGLYYVLKKDVNWSFLHEGFNIEVSIQVAFQQSIKTFLPRGTKKTVYFILEGRTYKAELKNQAFDESAYPRRKDITQEEKTLCKSGTIRRVILP